MASSLAAPEDPQTFRRCKLDWSEFDRHSAAVALHRDLLRLRREDLVFSAQAPGALDGAVLGPDAFALRFFGNGGDDRLLLVNFGVDLNRRSLPEPLMAPPERRRWTLLWSSEDPDYGGNGTPTIETEQAWRVPGNAAVVLTAEAGLRD
jgi:maltooligosyltrehalose trehalohydrolase